MSGHYRAGYFAWQQPIGQFGGWANLTKFIEYINASDSVLDFGCGGGFLLRNIDCARRMGVEINETARQTAKANGVEVYAKASDVPDSSADKIISNNALEHTLQPLAELQTLHRKLKRGGKTIFVVPCESVSYVWRPDDVNWHLYSWSPMCIGNLLTEAGFDVIESKPYIHKWPPFYRHIARFGGRRGFEIACRIYGRLERSWFQVRAVATKS